MNENFITTDGGRISISEDVISVISAIAAKEVEGLASMGGNLLGNLGDIIAKKNQGKGVKVEFGENGLVIDVHITVKFGVKIREVSASIQEHIKSAVETMSGLNVATVNVFVDGVELEKAKTNEVSE